MTTPATTSPGRYAAGLLFHLGILIALFAMHGPSSGHTMLIPGSGPSAAMPSTGTAPIAMTSTEPGGASVAVHRLSTGHGPAATGSLMGSMTHSDCVAAPRQHPVTVIGAPPVVATDELANPASAAATLIASAGSDRAPPPPDLAALGIWRR